MVSIQQISCATHQNWATCKVKQGNFVAQQIGARKLLNFVACLTLALLILDRRTECMWPNSTCLWSRHAVVRQEPRLVDISYTGLEADVAT